MSAKATVSATAQVTQQLRQCSDCSSNCVSNYFERKQRHEFDSKLDVPIVPRYSCFFALYLYRSSMNHIPVNQCFTFFIPFDLWAILSAMPLMTALGALLHPFLSLLLIWLTCSCQLYHSCGAPSSHYPFLFAQQQYILPHCAFSFLLHFLLKNCCPFPF